MKSFGIVMTFLLVLSPGLSLRAEDAPLEVIMMDEAAEAQDYPEPVPVELQEPAPPVQIVEPAPQTPEPPQIPTKQVEAHPQSEMPAMAVEMLDVSSFVELVQEHPTLPQLKIENFDAVTMDPPRVVAKPLRTPKKLAKKPLKKKNKVAKKLPRKLPKKKKVPVVVPDEEDWEVEDDRNIASDGSRSFTARVSNITEFNGIWEVSFTDEPGRYRIFGSPDSFADYQHSSQFLEVRVDDFNRRIIEVKPIRARFRPIR